MIRNFQKTHQLTLESLLLQENYTESSPSMGLGSALSTVPSTLTRWSEAAKVLDGDSMHDCMAGEYCNVNELT